MDGFPPGMDEKETAHSYGLNTRASCQWAHNFNRIIKTGPGCRIQCWSIFFFSLAFPTCMRFWRYPCLLPDDPSGLNRFPQCAGASASQVRSPAGQPPHQLSPRHGDGILLESAAFTRTVLRIPQLTSAHPRALDSPKPRNAALCPTSEIANVTYSTHAEGQKLEGNLRLGGRLLLLLALVLGKGKLEDFQDFLIRDLVVGLELGQIPGRGTSEPRDAVLGDGCMAWSVIVRAHMLSVDGSYRWWSMS